MTLSDDGQWMWDGAQWVPAHSTPAPAPAAPNSQLSFSDPNSLQSAPQPFGGQPMMDPNPGGWAPESSSASGGKSFPVAVIVAAVILIVGGATGGVLWATGVFGSSSDDVVGIWYSDNDQDGIQFTENGNVIIIEDGSPEDYGMHSYKWSASGDTMTLVAVQRGVSGDFTCDNVETIPGSWVNDGYGDCDDNSDEGVDTSSLAHEDDTMTVVLKFEVVGDVMFVGVLSVTEVESDGSTEIESVSEAQICTASESECMVWVRSSALNNVNIDTIVNGVTAPSWYVAPSDDDNYDY